MSVLTPDLTIESPRRRRLHLISGGVVFTLLYCGAMLVIRNLVV